MDDASAQLFAVALAATWCGFGLYGIVRKLERSPQAREMLRRFRQARLSTKAALLAGLVAVVAVGGTKPGGTNDPPRGLRSPPATVAAEPAFAPVEVRTNNVTLRAESASAVEVEDWRKHGQWAPRFLAGRFLESELILNLAGYVATPNPAAWGMSESLTTTDTALQPEK